MLILGSITEVFTAAGLWIVTGIYKFAAFVFQVFLILASGSILEPDSYKMIVENFYVLLGVIMLFIISFTLLKGMINVDDQKSGTSNVRKIIINLITSVIIIAILPTCFSFIYDFQTSVISDYNVIGKFFGYGNVGSDSDNPSNNTNLEKVKSGSFQIVNGVYTAFLNVNRDSCLNDGSKEIDIIKNCQNNYNSKEKRKYNGESTETTHTFYQTIKEVDATGKFGYYADFADSVDLGVIDFSFLLCLIGGLLLIYVGVSYCFDMALRLVKLVFYQLIAPIPVFFRIVPEGKLSGTFNTWLKITGTCYLEVFVRIFVFYFCVYLCVTLTEPGTFIGTTVINDYGFFLGIITKAFTLMGIITFMRSAPKLIGEITGLDSGNMKLGIKEKLAAGGAFTAGALAGGAITSMVNNATNKWGNKDNWKNQKTGKYTPWSIAKNFGAGALSIGAGTISGAARSGKAGWNAKSFGDMKNAASSGVKGAMDARDTRASYKAQHGGTVLGAIGGHIKDTAYNVGRWAGFSNINDLLGANKIIEQIQSERKAIDNEAFDIIDGDLAKGKTSTAYDSSSAAASALGVTHSMATLREKKAAIEELKAAGASAAKIAAAEAEYSNYRNNFANELRNITLLGASKWKTVDKAIQADLSTLRTSTDKYRETVSRNIHMPFVTVLSSVDPNYRDILDKDKDLTVTSSTLDAIKNELKIAKTENSRKINEIRQKEQDSKKGK